MSDHVAEMLEQVGKELAQAGVSLETLSAQALGKMSMDAPGGLSALALKFSPEHALWFFEFLRGYLMSPVEDKPGEVPDPGKLSPQVMAALAAFPLSEAERKEILDSLIQPFGTADHPDPVAEQTSKTGAVPEESPEEMIANLEKKVEELQKQLDAKLAEIKAEPPAAEPPEGQPKPAPEASESAVNDVEKAVEDLQKALEEALGKLPQGEATA